MAVTFHHGVRVTQNSSDVTTVRLADTSVVGIIGTAPDADAAAFPLNTPVVVTNPTAASALGTAGTLYENLETIFDQQYTKVVVVRIDEAADSAELLANAVGSSISLTGINAMLKATSLGLPKPKLLLAPGIGTTAPADGIASVAVTAGGEDYSGAVTLTIAGATGQGCKLSATVAGGVITAVNIDKPGWGYTAPVTVTATDGAGSGATFTATIGSVMNPIVAEAMSVAEKLKAMFYADGPDGTDAQAVAARNLIGSKRIFFCDPRVLKSIDGASTPMPSSALHVGTQAKMDKLHGPHWPGTNVDVAGIVGLNRAIVYGDQSDYLNENRVNTVINRGDGFKTWGVWTCASDSLWQFVNVVRTTDAVNEAIEDAFMAFVGRPMTLANLDAAVWSGKKALKDFESDGMLLPGSVFKLSDDNTTTTHVQGIVKFTMAFEVPAPMIDIRIAAYRNVEVGYTLLFNAVTGEVSIEAE